MSVPITEASRFRITGGGGGRSGMIGESVSLVPRSVLGGAGGASAGGASGGASGDRLRSLRL